MIKTISKENFAKFLEVSNAIQLIGGEQILIATNGPDGEALNAFKKVSDNFYHIDSSELIEKDAQGVPGVDFGEFLEQSAPYDEDTILDEEFNFIIVDGFKLLNPGLKYEYGHFNYDILIVE